MITSSPVESVAIIALKIACFAPLEMEISSTEYCNEFSVRSFSMIASRNATSPGTTVYRVTLSRMAWTAASFTCWGVLKSGSPMPRSITACRRLSTGAPFARAPESLTVLRYRVFLQPIGSSLEFQCKGLAHELMRLTKYRYRFIANGLSYAVIVGFTVDYGSN